MFFQTKDFIILRLDSNFVYTIDDATLADYFWQGSVITSRVVINIFCLSSFP